MKVTVYGWRRNSGMADLLSVDVVYGSFVSVWVCVCVCAVSCMFRAEDGYASWTLKNTILSQDHAELVLIGLARYRVDRRIVEKLRRLYRNTTDTKD